MYIMLHVYIASIKGMNIHRESYHGSKELLKARHNEYTLYLVGIDVPNEALGYMVGLLPRLQKAWV